ncbi:MAG: DNA polymerase III subunit delta [Jatrophihabitans sp.]|uniref:DNA polymerase III subunit delta n=1 Tax=Jatrophihabitans sp. TaxID=1932789 RepID=UPI003F7D36DC
MPSRAITAADLPTPLPAAVLLVGDEELFVERAISAISSAARAADPSVVESELQGSAVDVAQLAELLSPSLFGDAKLILLRAAQDVKVAALPAVQAHLQSPTPDTVILLQHAGGAKGKAVLDAARKAKALEIGCAKLTRADDRAEFVRDEVRRAGGRIAADAVTALLEAVGSDLRELAATANQLVSDGSGAVTLDLVRAFHRGKAEVSGFAVSDHAVAGRRDAALEALRNALAVGVPHVVIADALADGVRSVARVSAAGRGSEYDLAKRLGMPPWKVKRAQGQARGWNEPGLRRALGVVADLNADVKGAAVDPSYAIERAIGRVIAARGAR